MSLASRMDNRDIDTFRKNIRDYTARERVWMNIYVTHLKQQGHHVTYSDNGVDNSGSLIGGTLKNHNVDYTLHTNVGDIKVEIKQAPKGSRFFTFKATSLESCVDQHAYIQLMQESYRFSISPSLCQYILDNYPKRIYERFSPNDPSIRLTLDELSNLCPPIRWATNAQKMIADNMNILFTEKGKKK